MMRFFKKIFELTGIDQIAAYAKSDVFKVMELINFYDFPAQKELMKLWNFQDILSGPFRD